MGSMGSGIIFGVSSWKEECRDCGYQGSPIVFESVQDYERFLKEIKGKQKSKATKNSKGGVQGTQSRASDKKKQVADQLPQEEATTQPVICEETGRHKKDWRIEIYIAIGLAIVASLLFSGKSIALFGVVVGILYLVLYFVLLFIAFLFAIVVVEYFITQMPRASKR
jgi:sensor c-di-GMP phosphodiesterase-like protein